MNRFDEAPWPAGLDELFQRYRAATPDPEPSAAFMPGIWERIETRQSLPVRMRGLATRFLTVSVALCLMMAAVQSVPGMRANPTMHASYLDALADDHAPETLTYAELVRTDGGDSEAR